MTEKLKGISEKQVLNILYSISNKIAYLEHTFQISVKLSVDGADDDDNFYYLVDSDDDYENKDFFDDVKEKFLAKLETEYNKVAEWFISKHQTNKNKNRDD